MLVWFQMTVLFFLGNMRLRIQFNGRKIEEIENSFYVKIKRKHFLDAIPKDLTVIVMSEHSAVMELGKDGHVTISYSPR